MIDYVSPGQKIQADTINSLIANANYVGTPTTTYQFTTGPNGQVHFSTGPLPETGNFATASDPDFPFKCQVNVLSIEGQGRKSRWSVYIGQGPEQAVSAFIGPIGPLPGKFTAVPLSAIKTSGIVADFTEAKKVEADGIKYGWLSSDLEWPSTSALYLHQYYEDQKEGKDGDKLSSVELGVAISKSADADSAASEVQS